MFCNKKNKTAKDDFEEAINYLYPTEETKSNIIFEFYFSQLNAEKTKLKFYDNAKNLNFTNTSFANLDYDSNASEVSKMCYRKNLKCIFSTG
jgi:hypothetical protein